MLQVLALIELYVGWFVWSLAFWQPSRLKSSGEETSRAKSSKWGIGLVMAAFAFAFAYVRPAGFSKPAAELVASMILVPPAVALGWAAARRLGKQWRFQAAIRQDHELIKTGPYRFVRHPIYASMLMMLVATVLAWTWWPMAVVALALYVIGTEIRVRAEEKLLTEHFGTEYASYRTHTRAYVPFLR